MKILLTGATGYIGRRLLSVLIEDGHHIWCCVRDKKRFDTTGLPQDQINVLETNFLEPSTLEVIPNDLDAAYYLIHSMSASLDDFDKLERACAQNFADKISKTNTEQVIYLSGIANTEELSEHLKSRRLVEDVLSSGTYHLTTLRAGIIVGSGSGSFEIIRDLVEKLPLMIAPKWLKTKSQPIAISNIIEYLKGVLKLSKTYDMSFDVGGPEVLTYKEMLLKFAQG